MNIVEVVNNVDHDESPHNDFESISSQIFFLAELWVEWPLLRMQRLQGTMCPVVFAVSIIHGSDKQYFF